MEKFKYSNSMRVVDWGLGFDSVLELKYAISIHQEYEFLHAAVPVFYDPSKLHVVWHPHGNARRYTPDFLIRHRVTHKAFWVEIKPDKYDDEEALLRKQRLASHFIRIRKLDWEFKIVRGDEIKLTTDQLVQFNECCSYLFAGEKIPVNVNPFGVLLSRAKVNFVLHGVDRFQSFWKR